MTRAYVLLVHALVLVVAAGYHAGYAIHRVWRSAGRTCRQILTRR